MWFKLRGNPAFLITFILLLRCSAWSIANDAEFTHQLSLSDLVKYRAALTGKATGDDARESGSAIRVLFKDLWNRPEALYGQRVMIEGRVQRIFRQGPVGTFPALAEIWIASPAGDPFCLVFPQGDGSESLSVNNHSLKAQSTSQQIPKPGQVVRFTGTFLKIIRYSAGDGSRLAPLVVGDQSPVSVRAVAKVDGAGSFSPNHQGSRRTASPGTWFLGLTLALLTAGVLARRHLRQQSQRTERRDRHSRVTAYLGADPPLEFIEPRTEP